MKRIIYSAILLMPFLCFSEDEILEKNKDLIKFREFLIAFEKLNLDLYEKSENQNLYYLGKAHAYGEILINLNCSSFYKDSQD